jgi:hypothetical protein
MVVRVRFLTSASIRKAPFTLQIAKMLIGCNGSGAVILAQFAWAAGSGQKEPFAKV